MIEVAAERSVCDNDMSVFRPGSQASEPLVLARCR
jgi:hypothetical protein